MTARRSRPLAVLAIAGRVARITTVVAAGCGEFTDGPSLVPDVPPMTVEARSIPPEPIDRRIEYWFQ